MLGPTVPFSIYGVGYVGSVLRGSFCCYCWLLLMSGLQFILRFPGLLSVIHSLHVLLGCLYLFRSLCIFGSSMGARLFSSELDGTSFGDLVLGVNADFLRVSC